MTGCIFCDAVPANLDHGVKTSSRCDLVDGGPCHPCQECFKLDRQIQDVNKTLEDTKKTLDDLVAQRRKILSKLNRRHDPITRRFPTEIISLIFQYALPDKWTSFDELGDETVDRELISGPLFLGSVCRAWRRIAWSSPRMWTVVRIVMNSKDDNYHRLDVLRSWLSRSKKLPLSIRIAFRASKGYKPDEGPVEMNLIAGLIDLANGQCFRWNELEVQAPSWIYPGINVGIQHASNIHTLRAAVRGDDPSRRILLDSPDFRPTHVALHRVFLQTFNTDWSHVTRISVSRFSSDECVELLRRAVRLMDCEFLDVLDDGATFPFPARPMIHSSLHTLFIRLDDALRDLDNSVQRAILNSFIFPSLCSVDLQDPEAGSLLKLITRSSCPITSLTISAEGFEGNLSLRSFLSKVPTLQHLTLNSETSATEAVYPFLDLLAASSVPTSSLDQSVSDSGITQIIVPNLKSLNFLGFLLTNEFWEHLSHIFGPVSEVGHPNMRPLKKLRVDREAEWTLGEEDYIDKEVALKFMELRDGGITLDFTDDGFKTDLLDLSIAHYA